MHVQSATLQAVRQKSKDWNDSKVLQERRESALSALNNLDFPSFRYGLGISLSAQHVPVDSFLQLHYSPQALSFTSKNSKEQLIEFEKQGVVIDTIQNVVKKNPNLLSFSSVHHSAFSAVHDLNLHNGLVVCVPKNVIVKTPVIIDFNSVSEFQFDELWVIVEEGAELTFIENIFSSPSSQLRSAKVNLIVKENAQLNFSSVQNLNQNTFQYYNKQASVSKNGRLNWLQAEFGSSITTGELASSLIGENASVQQHSIFFGTHSQQFDLNFSSKHLAPRTHSRMISRGALTGRSKSIFRGLIKIAESAPFSNGVQNEKTLLLSPTVEADAIPNLEIDNREVKCTHGATIGEIDENELFYMMSRGLSEKEAQHEIVQGFFQPLLLSFPQEIVESIQKLVNERIQ